MSWSEEVHEHKSKVEQRREKLRDQGVDVEEANKADLVPLAVLAAVVVGCYVWFTDRHKLKHKGILGRLAFFPRILGLGKQEMDPRAAAREAAEARLRNSQVGGFVLC